MALSYKARKRWSIFILTVGLPLYIAAVWYILSLLEGWNIWLQLGVCLAFSMIWAFPLKAVFLGVGKADPDAPRPKNSAFDAKKGRPQDAPFP